jgi:hypothetical protein
MTQPSRPTSLSHISLCGAAVRVENVQLLAHRFGDDELGRKLERAVANDNSIVALSTEDRRRILDVLEQPSIGLAELRTVLQGQLRKHAEREARYERMRYGQASAERSRVSAETTRYPIDE